MTIMKAIEAAVEVLKREGVDIAFGVSRRSNKPNVRSNEKTRRDRSRLSSTCRGCLTHGRRLHTY